jgi:hypothetical protein
MTSYITGAASLFESELDVVGVYKIHRASGNRYLTEMPVHTHRKPTQWSHAALTLTYRSLGSSRRSICNGCKKVRKLVSMYFGKVTHWKIEQIEQRKGYSKRWSASCWRIVCGGSGIQTIR